MAVASCRGAINLAAMCGRYVLKRKDLEALLQELGVKDPREFASRYNIAPGTVIPAIRATAEAGREAVGLQWGLVPWWSKDAAGGAACQRRAEASPSRRFARYCASAAVSCRRAGSISGRRSKRQTAVVFSFPGGVYRFVFAALGGREPDGGSKRFVSTTPTNSSDPCSHAGDSAGGIVTCGSITGGHGTEKLSLC